MRRCLNCMREYAEHYGDRCPYCGYTDGATQNGGVCLKAGSILQGRYIVGTVSRTREIDIFYHAWDALFDRKVEIQEYFPRYCVTRSGKEEVSVYSSKQDKYDEGLELFCRDSRELIRLYREKNAATYQACFRENGTAYAVLDDCGDGTVRSLFEMSGPFFRDEEEALRVMDAVLETLEKCHRLGVIHGMVDADCLKMPGAGSRPCDFVLSDFGSWRYVSGEPGVVGYGSPGPETDVYGAARLLYELLSGTPCPEETDGKGTEMSRMLLLSDRRAREALARALNHEFRTAAEFRGALNGQYEPQTESMAAENYEPQKKPLPDAAPGGPSVRRPAKKSGSASLSVPRWVYLAAAGCGLLIACAGIRIAFGHFGPRAEESRMERGMVRMPNLIGSNVDEAEKRLKKLGLTMLRSDSGYSEEYENGQIIHQDIKESDQIEKGAAVHVTVSLGEKTGVIPSVIGRRREDAETALKKAGFENLIFENDEKTGGVYDTVLAVSEKPGTSVPVKNTVTLTVCMRQDSPQEETVEVPDAEALLSRMTKEEAEEEFQKAGLRVSWIEEYSDTLEAGKTIGQTPAAGETARQDSAVQIRISAGREKLCLDQEKLLYRPQAEAEQALLEQGFQVGTPHRDFSDSVPKGSVIRVTDEEKNPLENGALLERGTKVSLWTSLGSDPAAEQETQAPVQKQTQAPPQKQTQETTKAQETAAKQTQPQSIPEQETAAAASSETETIEPNPAGTAQTEGQKNREQTETGAGYAPGTGQTETDTGGPGTVK